MSVRHRVWSEHRAQTCFLITKNGVLLVCSIHFQKFHTIQGRSVSKGRYIRVRVSLCLRPVCVLDCNFRGICTMYVCLQGLDFVYPRSGLCPKLVYIQGQECLSPRPACVQGPPCAGSVSIDG